MGFDAISWFPCEAGLISTIPQPQLQRLNPKKKPLSPDAGCWPNEAPIRVLAHRRKNITLVAMKFALAILVYVVIALILGAGILQVVHGQPWLLIAGAVGFVVAFARIGCKSH